MVYASWKISFVNPVEIKEKKEKQGKPRCSTANLFVQVIGLSETKLVRGSFAHLVCWCSPRHSRVPLLMPLFHGKHEKVQIEDDCSVESNKFW